MVLVKILEPSSDRALMRRVALTPDNFPDRVLLNGFCGGAAYTADRAGKFYIIQDEGTMADFLSEDDLVDMKDELVKVLEFDTFDDRATYIQARGGGGLIVVGGAMWFYFQIPRTRPSRPPRTRDVILLVLDRPRTRR